MRSWWSSVINDFVGLPFVGFLLAAINIEFGGDRRDQEQRAESNATAGEARNTYRHIEHRANESLFREEAAEEAHHHHEKRNKKRDECEPDRVTEQEGIEDFHG